jgi:hypothetical protein
MKKYVLTPFKLYQDQQQHHQHNAGREVPSESIQLAKKKKSTVEDTTPMQREPSSSITQQKKDEDTTLTDKESPLPESDEGKVVARNNRKRQTPNYSVQPPAVKNPRKGLASSKIVEETPIGHGTDHQSSKEVGKKFWIRP